MAGPSDRTAKAWAVVRNSFPQNGVDLAQVVDVVLG